MSIHRSRLRLAVKQSRRIDTDLRTVSLFNAIEVFKVIKIIVKHVFIVSAAS